jgi:hypothetical protein
LGAVPTAKCCRCATPSLSGRVQLFSARAPLRSSFGAETQRRKGPLPPWPEFRADPIEAG